MNSCEYGDPGPHIHSIDVSSEVELNLYKSFCKEISK